MVLILLIINFIIFTVVGICINEILGIFLFIILNAMLLVFILLGFVNTDKDNEVKNVLLDPTDLTTNDMIEFSIIRHFMD